MMEIKDKYQKGSEQKPKKKKIYIYCKIGGRRGYDEDKEMRMTVRSWKRNISMVKIVTERKEKQQHLKKKESERVKLEKKKNSNHLKKENSETKSHTTIIN